MKHLLALGALACLSYLLYQLWPTAAVGGLIAEATGKPVPRLGDLDRVDAADVPEDALRVLFVGNSHTHMNDMPSMIAGLARAAEAPRPFWYAMVAPGGARLEDHVRDGRAEARMRGGRWDHVVLQEQQQWPSFSREQRERELHPPARTLDAQARMVGARTLLFMTWARRAGDTFNHPDDSYAEMHARVRTGYAELAQELGADVVPVGEAWHWALQQRPQLSLWAPDGYHASALGSYLAACSFYAAIYGASPEGNAFTADLPASDAAFVQRAADRSRR